MQTQAQLIHVTPKRRNRRRLTQTQFYELCRAAEQNRETLAGKRWKSWKRVSAMLAGVTGFEVGYDITTMWRAFEAVGVTVEVDRQKPEPTAARDGNAQALLAKLEQIHTTVVELRQTVDGLQGRLNEANRERNAMADRLHVLEEYLTSQNGFTPHRGGKLV